MRAYAAPDTQALRGWQRRALVRYLAAQPRDFLAVATPGSGKTAFALRVAGELLADGAVDRITVVVPTEHLKIQWALAAAAVGSGARPEVLQLGGADVLGVPRCRRHLRPGGQPPRRDTGCAPRTTARWSCSTRSTTAATRRVGARRSARRSATPPAGWRSPAPRFAATTARSRSSPTNPTATALLRSTGRPQSTATPRRWPTAWCGRWSSWPTPARRAGAPAPARSTPPGSVSR